MFEVVAAPFIEKDLLRRVQALFIHPFIHRRELMSSPHRIFLFCEDLVPGVFTPWAPDIRDEVVACALLLPLAVVNMRWPVSSTMSMTDATPTTAGAVRAEVSLELAEAFFDITETRGANVRMGDLRGNVMIPKSKLRPQDSSAISISQCIPWRVSRSYHCKRSAHVNVQELSEMKLERCRAACETLIPQRRVGGSDSRVSIGAG